MIQKVNRIDRIQSIDNINVAARAIQPEKVAVSAIKPELVSQLTQISPAVLDQIVIPVDSGAQSNLPDTSTQSGNLFRDRFNSNLYWYLPTFSLADDPDPLFSFAASQTGVDVNGDPFHKACLQIGLKQLMPVDVANFSASNPTIELRVIPLQTFTVILSITYKDAAGTDQHSSFTGSMIPSDGTLQLIFDNILSNNVIILYENLTQAVAQVSISAIYNVWRAISGPRIIERDPPERWESPPIILPRLQAEAFAPRSFMKEAVAVNPSIAIRREIFRLPDDSDPPPPRTKYIYSSAQFNLSLTLDQKYAANAYQLRYTVTENSVQRPIININDLKDFNLRQSEFMELKVLGDISQRYPSLRELYVGTLSRTIVVIPNEYVIVRESNHCDAICIALVDSDAIAHSNCKFQFEFLLSPNISAIEFLQLTQEISQHPDFKDYVLKLPDSLHSTNPSKLVTAFQSSNQYLRSTIAHCFSLMVEIKDEPFVSPAVANANLLIKQLCLPQQPYLAGTLNLKLDDNYTLPVEANVSLNFQATSGIDDFTYTVNEAAQSIQFINRSVFNLQLKQYALCTSAGVSLLPLNQVLASGQTIEVPLPPDHTGLIVLVDYAPALTSAIPKSQIGPYLQFQTQDVQKTQYQLGINASGVNFDGRGIDKIDVQVSLPALTEISVPAFSLYALHKADSTNILIPIQYAISSLDATLLFTVHFKDAAKPAVQFSKQNDFVDVPILVLQDADLNPVV